MKIVKVRLELVELDDYESYEQPEEKVIYKNEYELEPGYYDTDKVQVMNNTAFNKYTEYWRDVQLNCEHEYEDSPICMICGEVRDEDDQF